MKVKVEGSKKPRKFIGGLQVYIELETNAEVEIFYQIMNLNSINTAIANACVENPTRFEDVESLKTKIYHAIKEADHDC